MAAIVMAAFLRTEVQALRVTVTQQDVERAYAVARGADDLRARFHAPYILPISDDTIQRLEIVTEYRRYVLAAEEQLRLGNWTVARGSQSLGGRGIADDLQPWKGRVSVVVQLRFNPLNTFQYVPEYEITLGDGRITPISITRSPELGLPSNPGARTGGVEQHLPILGAVVEAAFDAGTVGQTSQTIRLALEGQTIRTLTADFARLE